MNIDKFISIIFHPVFMPSMTILLITKQYLNIIVLAPQVPIVIIGTIIFSLALPLLSVFFLLLIKKIESLEVRKKEERFLPLLLTIIWMTIGFYYLKEVLNYTPIIKSIYLGAIYVLILSLFITRFWKISLHMLAIGGLTGVLLTLELLYGQNLNFLLLFVFISGCLGFSRYSLNAHTLKQIYGGYLLGNIIMCLSMLYL